MVLIVSSRLNLFIKDEVYLILMTRRVIGVMKASQKLMKCKLLTVAELVYFNGITVGRENARKKVRCKTIITKYSLY